MTDHNAQRDFTLTHKEYSALMDIRGMHQNAHLLVMTASFNSDEKSATITGTTEDFDHLFDDIMQDLEEDLAPKKNRAALTRIVQRLGPELGFDFF